MKRGEQNVKYKFHYTHDVTWGELDAQQHVNNVVYFSK